MLLPCQLTGTTEERFLDVSKILKGRWRYNFHEIDGKDHIIDQYRIIIGFMQLAKFSPPNRESNIPILTASDLQLRCRRTGTSAIRLRQDNWLCRGLRELENWPMRIGPLLLVASHDFWHCYQWTFLVGAAAKKVKPKVELRGSIMALSNTGGRWWANWWALKRMAKTVLLQYKWW